MQRVHLEAMSPATAPAQLAAELGPPDWYRQAKTTVPSLPSWRAGEEASQPLGSFVIELDLT